MEVIDTMLVCHFVDLDLGVKVFFEKEGVMESGDVDVEMRGQVTCCILVLGVT